MKNPNAVERTRGPSERKRIPCACDHHADMSELPTQIEQHGDYLHGNGIWQHSQQFNAEAARRYNCHNELVAALEAVVAWDDGGVFRGAQLKPLIEQARTVLAKVRSGTA